jgi:hypothetical protein
MDKFGSVIDRMNMKLGSKFLNSLSIKIQLLKRLQCVNVVDGAIHSQKDRVEVNEDSLRMVQRLLCSCCAALSWFCSLVSSQLLHLILRWTLR